MKLSITISLSSLGKEGPKVRQKKRGKRKVIEMHFLIKRNLFDKTVAFVNGYILVLTSMRIMGLDLIKKVMAQGQAQGLKSRLRSRIYLIYCDVEFPANNHFWMRTNFANS